MNKVRKAKTPPCPDGEDIIGPSQVMAELRELIKETAVSDARILIT
jgi:DNA-binding NtrC family response regulator